MLAIASWSLATAPGSLPTPKFGSGRTWDDHSRHQEQVVDGFHHVRAAAATLGGNTRADEPPLTWVTNPALWIGTSVGESRRNTTVNPGRIPSDSSILPRKVLSMSSSKAKRPSSSWQLHASPATVNVRARRPERTRSRFLPRRSAPLPSGARGRYFRSRGGCR